MTWFLIAVRQDIKSINNLVAVHELELAINVNFRVVYEVKVTSTPKESSNAHTLVLAFS